MAAVATVVVAVAAIYFITRPRWKRLDGQDHVVGFSADGRVLATIGKDGIHLSADGTFLAAWPGLKRDSESGQIHIHHLRKQQKDVILHHPKPKYRNRHAETVAVCFADDNQRIITCDTLAIRVWGNIAAKNWTGESNARLREPREQP